MIKYLTSLIVTSTVLLPWSASAATSLSSFVEYTGEAADDAAGDSLVTGDINNDGYDDVIVSAICNSDAGSCAGAVYLIYGQSSTLSSGSLSTAVEFTGEAADDGAGHAVATGDVNNDGYDDIIVGATGNENNEVSSSAGAVYLIYGQSSTLSSGSLSSYVKFSGDSAGDLAGSDVATGDVNNDGYDDILIGAYGNDDAASGAGAIYVIYGQSSTLLSSSLASRTIFTGEAASDAAGYAVATGDVNNDGYDDILVGAIGNDDGGSLAGAVYLLSGQANTFVSGSLSTRVQFTGEAAGDRAGSAIATGDVNNDGYDDILVGAYGNDDAASEAGAIYVIYGKSTALSSGSLSSYAQFTGEAASDRAGYAVTTGDVNNDGYDDIYVGAYNNDDAASNAGAVYQIRGQASTFASGSLSTRVQFTGEAASDRAGYAVATGDVNNDGYDDILVGAYNSDDAASGAGAAYLGYLYIDSDHDGVAGTAGVLATGSDCNDSDSSISALQTYYYDGDGDGYGISTNTTTTCSTTAPSDYVSNDDDTNDNDYDNDGTSTSSDCNDTDSTISANQTYYRDADSDGLGNATVTTTTCSLTPPTGYVINSSDTNDTVSSGDSDNDDDGVAATSDCNDADSSVSSYQTYYQDSDGDGFGSTTVTTSVCSATAPAGYVTNSTDTNDSDYDNDGTNTVADCNDADSTIANNQTYYQDSDGDGLGNASVSTTACSTTSPSGYVTNASDTDDTVTSGDNDNDDDGVAATSDCNDADSSVSSYQTYYQDSDGDGYGNPNLSTSVCSATAPTGYVDNALDTDDTDSTVTYLDISSVAGTSDGDIIVTYEDDSSTQYDIFTVTATKPTVAAQVPDTTLIVVVHPKARKMALVDGLTGEVLSQKKLNSKTHSKVKLLVKDLRSDDKYEAIVVAKRGSKTVHVDLFSIKVAKLKLKLRDETVVKHKKILPSKTKAKKKHIKLRRKNGQVVQEYTVNKKYRLVD